MFTRLNVSLETYEEGCWQILNYENVERKSKDSLPLLLPLVRTSLALQQPTDAQWEQYILQYGSIDNLTENSTFILMQ